MTSQPLKLPQNLKVNIVPKSSSSIQQQQVTKKISRAQTPTEEIEIDVIANEHSYELNINNNSYPNTPIGDDPSYTLNTNKTQKTKTIPITPITPTTLALNNNLSNTQSLTPKHNKNKSLTPKNSKRKNSKKRSQSSHHPAFKNNYSNSLSSKYYHSNQNSNSNSNSGNQFPDTPNNPNDTNAPLYEMDEKQIDEKNIKKNKRHNKNKPSKKRRTKSKKFSLMDNDTKNGENKKNNKIKVDEDETLRVHGYKREKFIANTLQGKTFTARYIDIRLNKQELVIKTTNKELYNKGITVTKDGKAFNIKEDIVAESVMMREFMNNNPPASLIGFIDFFEDEEFYYLVMEHGGTDFFDFVVKCHELINEDKLSMKEWRKQCKFIFAQMIQFIKWLHETMNYCHLDISLENLLISNMAYFDESNGKLNKCYIKFIDFGLSEKFDKIENPLFICNKYVGKTHYKAPKVYGKKEQFMANRADIWSLGVALFMMVIGAPPYNRPTNRDPGFRFIAEKKMTKLLYSWGRIKYVTPNLYGIDVF